LQGKWQNEDGQKKVELSLLKDEMANKFEIDENFRKILYEKIREIYQRPGKEQETPELGRFFSGEGVLDKDKLFNAIDEDIYECAKVLYPEMTKEYYEEHYRSDDIATLFLNNKKLYRAYCAAIARSDYYVFVEEIPMIASLSNRKLLLCFERAETRPQLYDPDPAIYKAYQKYRAQSSSSFVWPKNELEITPIYLEGVHYSRGAESLLTALEKKQTGEASNQQELGIENKGKSSDTCTEEKDDKKPVSHVFYGQQATQHQAKIDPELKT